LKKYHFVFATKQKHLVKLLGVSFILKNDHLYKLQSARKNEPMSNWNQVILKISF